MKKVLSWTQGGLGLLMLVLAVAFVTFIWFWSIPLAAYGALVLYNSWMIPRAIEMEKLARLNDQERQAVILRAEIRNL